MAAAGVASLVCGEGNPSELHLAIVQTGLSRFGKLFSLGHEDCGCEGGDGNGSRFGVVSGLAGGGVARALLDGVKLELEALEASVGESGLGVGRVEDYNNVLVLAVVAAIGVELHNDEAGGLALSSVEEGQVLLDLIECGHAEEVRAVADLQQFLEGVAAVGDVDGLRGVGGVAEQWRHDRPLALVLAGDGQADTPVGGLAAPVDLVEPVSGVVAVLVHVFRAEEVVSGLEEGKAFAEGDERHAHDLAAGAGGDGVIER